MFENDFIVGYDGIESGTMMLSMEQVEALDHEVYESVKVLGPVPQELMDVLEFYANPENWKEHETGIGMMPSDAEMDGGVMARNVLNGRVAS